MPYADMKNRKKQFNPAVGAPQHEARMERQRARRLYDKKGIDRKGRDISHKVALSRGGSNADGLRLQSPAANRKNNFRQTRYRV